MTISTNSMTFRPYQPGANWYDLKKINWSWLLKRAPMVALAILSSWGVRGFILQSEKANDIVAWIGAGAFDLVFLGAIALADQSLSRKRSTHYLYWALNIGAAAVSALLNTLYYSGGHYSGMTLESVTHGVPFAIFGLLYSLYYHGVMSEVIEVEYAEQDRLSAIVHCRYCGKECANRQAEYSHYRTCPQHPKNKGL
jgi:hypothetical protein